MEKKIEKILLYTQFLFPNNFFPIFRKKIEEKLDFFLGAIYVAL